MKKIIPKAKLSKKARRKLNAEKRTTWAFSPVTKRVESKKIYNRKKISRTDQDEDGSGDFIYCRASFYSGTHSRRYSPPRAIMAVSFPPLPQPVSMQMIPVCGKGSVSP